MSIPLIPPVQTHKQHPHAIRSEQGADRVEFGCEDFEDDEREGELPECSANVRPFEGALRGADFDEPERGVSWLKMDESEKEDRKMGEVVLQMGGRRYPNRKVRRVTWE